MTNTRKHSGATRLSLRLHREPYGITLEVRDWGAGFDPEARKPGAPGERIGIAGMQERVALLRGSFTLISRPGQGTQIIADVPIEPRGAE